MSICSLDSLVIFILVFVNFFMFFFFFFFFFLNMGKYKSAVQIAKWYVALKMQTLHNLFR